MKKISTLIFALSILATLTGCSKKVNRGEFTVEEGKFKIGVSVDYPPFEYYAEDGKTALGFDIDLGKEVASRLGLEAVVVDTDWDGLMAGLDSERYDVIMSGMTITPERCEKYNFSTPYIGNGQAILLAQNSTLAISKPEDLNGKKVGYQTQTTSDNFMKKLKAEGKIDYLPAEYDKSFNAFDDLKFNRIDAVVCDSLVAADYLSKTSSEYRLVWTGLSDELMGICLSKSKTDFLEKINQAIASIIADGTMKKLYQKNFGFDMTSSLKTE